MAASLRLALVVAGYFGGLGMAQPAPTTADPLPEFDAAFLRPTPPDEAPQRPNGMPIRIFNLRGGPGTYDPGQLVCEHCSLEYLTWVAYEKTPLAVTVLDWMRNDLYDLIAKVPQGASEHDAHLMLQQLLSERFHMTVHHVSRQLPGLVMKVGKQAPNVQPSEAAAQGKLVAPYLEDCLFKVDAKGSTMSELADLLSRETRSPVVDKTGLEGRYHFAFAWLATVDRNGEGRCAPKNMPAGRDALDAVQKQLGLKIEWRKLPGDAVVVDSALEMPVAN